MSKVCFALTVVGHRKDQIVHSHLQLLHISLLTSDENLMLDQDNFYLLNLHILIICFLNDVSTLWGEVT